MASYSIVCEQVNKMLPTSHLDWGGRSTGTKIMIAVDYIEKKKPEKAVEIGVFRGAFSLAIACAMKQIDFGHITGVDPYLADESLEPESLPQYSDQIRALPFNEIYVNLVSTIKTNNLEKHIAIQRTTSAEAAKAYNENISLLHIDGNHDSIHVAEDIELWVPKVVSGAMIIMDDTNWPTVLAGMKKLSTIAKFKSDHGTFQVWEKL